MAVPKKINVTTSPAPPKGGVKAVIVWPEDSDTTPTGHGSPPHRAEEVVAALLTTRTQAEAARKLGISRPTLQRWMEKPKVSAAYLQARRAIVELAVARLQAAVDESVGALVGCLSAPDPWVRIKAAQTLLAHAVKAPALASVISRCNYEETVSSMW